MNNCEWIRCKLWSFHLRSSLAKGLPMNWSLSICSRPFSLNVRSWSDSEVVPAGGAVSGALGGRLSLYFRSSRSGDEPGLLKRSACVLHPWPWLCRWLRGALCPQAPPGLRVRVSVSLGLAGVSASGQRGAASTRTGAGGTDDAGDAARKRWEKRKEKWGKIGTGSLRATDGWGEGGTPWGDPGTAWCIKLGIKSVSRAVWAARRVLRGVHVSQHPFLRGPCRRWTDGIPVGWILGSVLLLWSCAPFCGSCTLSWWLALRGVLCGHVVRGLQPDLGSEDRLGCLGSFEVPHKY